MCIPSLTAQLTGRFPQSINKYAYLRNDRNKQDITQELDAYGTGLGYGEKILECEAALKTLKPGEVPYTALGKAR
jgi:hypothetical protein